MLMTEFAAFPPSFISNGIAFGDVNITHYSSPCNLIWMVGDEVSGDQAIGKIIGGGINPQTRG